MACLLACLLLASLAGGGIDWSAALGAPLPRTVGATRAWINVTGSEGSLPPMEFWPSMAFDPLDREFVLFGGCDLRACPLPAETWAFAHGRWSNLTSDGTQPPGRSYTTLAFDGADGYVLLFGGVGTSAVLADTWRFSGGTWVNLTGSLRTSPPSRWGAGMVYDPVLRGVVLFGGLSPQGTPMNDTWLYAAGSWHLLAPAVSPPARYEASMVWDAAAGVILLVDGCGAALCPLVDAWTFSGGTWSRVATSSLPPARVLAMMTYDAAAGEVRLFGGIANETSLGDTWTFVGGVWSPVAAAGSPSPRAREGSAVPEDTEAWLPDGTSLVWPYAILWGGDWVPCAGCPLSGFQDTWVFEAPPTANVSGSVAPWTAGRASILTGTVDGGTGPYAFAWTFGDGTSGTGAVVDHTYTTSGTYAVTLTTTDDAGATAIARGQVTVVSSPWLTWGFVLIGAVAVSVGLLAGRRWLGSRRARKRLGK